MILPENSEISKTEITLKMTNISRRFGPVQALADVTFTVRKGTVHALVGENGAGKSTLMKILAGVYKPDTGTIEINGKPYKFEKPQQALEAGISMIYQEMDLAEHLTVAENIFLGKEPCGKSPFTINDRIMIKQTSELAEKFSFQINPVSIIGNLSAGACQIVEILKALAKNTSIIVMDEPTSSLSEGEAESLFKTIRNLREKGLSIIYISHRLEEIIDLADDVTVLRDGNVAHSESIAKLDIPEIVKHMVGRELTDFFPSRDVKIGDVVLKAENICYGSKIKDINFEISAGEIVGMAGLIGAGRTEVAKAIFGVGKNTFGSIELDGKKIKINSPTDAISNGIGFLTEDRKRTGLCLGLACSWNITLPNLEIIGMKNFIKPGQENKIAEDIASQIAVKWASADSTADSLSGGNQQKLLIARWLLADSRFIIFDEPTRGIDIGAKKEVYLLLNKLAEQGKAILFISSELPELLGVADRILVMRRGKLVGNLKTAETSQEEIMHMAAVEEK
jgi:ABC-type sugar transport system ATPase subunit